MSTAKWVRKDKPPRTGAWYITRNDQGELDWRAWGSGSWWKQARGGWIRGFSGNGEPHMYEWLKGSKQCLSFDRDELPDVYATADALAAPSATEEAR